MEEIYLDILSIVEEVTGVSATEFLKSNCEEHVDARHILVAVLSECGYTDNKIAKLLNLTRPCVCIIRNNFKYRKKRYFVNAYYESVKSKIKSKELLIK